MIGLLVTILVLLVIFAIFYWIVTLIPLPQPFKQIAIAVLALIFVLVLLGAVGWIGDGPWVIRVH